MTGAHVRKVVSPGSVRTASRLALAAALAAASMTASASGLDQLRRFLDTTRSARADFEQTVSAKPGRAPQSASGTMAFSRPGRFRWVYRVPYDQVIVGDGEKLWIYDRELAQVTVRTLDRALGSSPAALLAGDNALERGFVLAEGGSSDTLEWVEATPRNAEAGYERIRIGLRAAVPAVMELRDNFGRSTTLRFSRFERNPALDASQFRFVPPAGADVIGE
ncbi:MAG: outer membrane lipoprotein carrier protein LolA [Rhodocyclales bacterium CG17_big_fil_post_rev_8_21_14_2_50_68_7]|nr:MAG: outer membrane lipoprotein carrier protein LolA [Rhodocyclales bacterium CG17_big_fil_post_rev_8_21_14_2_50_68_7]